MGVQSSEHASNHFHAIDHVSDHAAMTLRSILFSYCDHGSDHICDDAGDHISYCVRDHIWDYAVYVHVVANSRVEEQKHLGIRRN